MKETDLAYFAGIVDGEGHVCVKRKNLAIILCMADVAILEWCSATFGGPVSGEWKSEGGTARPRKMWSLRAIHGLESVATAMLPYLVLKRREVEVLVEALAHSRGRPGHKSALYPAWRDERAGMCDRAHEAMLARKAVS
jgi:hypothetical protein